MTITLWFTIVCNLVVINVFEGINSLCYRNETVFRNKWWFNLVAINIFEGIIWNYDTEMKHFLEINDIFNTAST